MRIRQVAFVARERDPVVRELCHILGTEVAFVDPGVEVFGLCNAVMPIGETFLEVVSPAREGTSAGRHLDRHGGDSGYMVIVQSRDLDGDRARMDGLGVRVVWEHAEAHTRTIHLHPRDVGGAILSLDESTPWDSWDWAGPTWRNVAREIDAKDSATAIAGAWLRAKDPDAMAARWGEILELPVTKGLEGAPCLALEESGIRFVRATNDEPEGIAGIDILAPHRRAVLARAQASGAEVRDNAFFLCGTEIRLVDAWRP